MFNSKYLVAAREDIDLFANRIKSVHKQICVTDGQPFCQFHDAVRKELDVLDRMVSQYNRFHDRDTLPNGMPDYISFGDIWGDDIYLGLFMENNPRASGEVE